MITHTEAGEALPTRVLYHRIALTPITGYKACPYVDAGTFIGIGFQKTRASDSIRAHVISTRGMKVELVATIKVMKEKARH